MTPSLRLSLCLLAALLPLLFGCVTTPVAPALPTAPESVSMALLRSGDSLGVAVLGVPDAATHQVQVDEQGFIVLPYIGRVRAAGSDTAGLAALVTRTYLEKRIYTSVDITVSVTERYIYVGGEVARPGRIVWTPDLTVAKAVQAAGGFTLYARESRVSLVRGDKAYDIDVTRARRTPEADPRLMPGDSIQVPRSPF